MLLSPLCSSQFVWECPISVYKLSLRVLWSGVSPVCKLTLSRGLLLRCMDVPAPLQCRACPHSWDWQRGPSAAPKRSGAPCVSFTPGWRSTAASSEAHSGPCDPCV